jgi:tetratricopeptide (TPR) repeat protein
MDWLDRLSIGAIAGITLIAMGMLANQAIVKKDQSNAGIIVAVDKKAAYALRMEQDKKIYHEVVSLKGQGLYAEAMAGLNDIMKKYPENSLSYVYTAQLHLGQGNLGEGIHSYRRAVEMEPDYVDDRTPLFIGDQIRELVTEGREKFGREKELKPKDREVRKILKDIYYLQSRLAGGCE